MLVLAAALVAGAPEVEPEMTLPPFSCESAAAWLGRPDGVVSSCQRVEHLEVWSLFLAHPALPGGGDVFHVAVRDGAPIAERGVAAVDRFLRDARVEELRGLDIREVGAALRALDGFPRGFDFETIAFELKGIGTSKLTRLPFRLRLYRALVFPGEGLPSGTRYERATLEGDPLTWTIERQERPRGPWGR